MSICTRSNPNKHHMMQEVNELRDKAVASGNTQVSSLKQEMSGGLFSKSNMWQVAKVAFGALIVIDALYECYSHAESTRNLYSINVEYGKQQWNQNATVNVQKIAFENPSLVCHIGDRVVDLLTCYARGLTDYFVSGQTN